MASPSNDMNNGCLTALNYFLWINSGFNPPQKSETWYIDGKSTLIMENHPCYNLYKKTKNISEITSILSSLIVSVDNSNSLKLGLQSPHIIKGAGKTYSTSGSFKGCQEFTYTIVYSFILNPDGSTQRLYIQTHIFRFLRVHSRLVDVIGAPNPLEDHYLFDMSITTDEIAEAVEGRLDDDYDLRWVAQRVVRQYYDCLVGTPDVAAREFFWDGSMMLMGCPFSQNTALITADSLPNIQRLIDLIDIVSVTLHDLTCLHEPHTNTILVDVSGLFLCHDEYRMFSELLCVSPSLLKNHNHDHLNSASDSESTGRKYRVACSIIEFIDPLPLQLLRRCSPLNKIPNPLMSPSFISENENTEEERPKTKRAPFSMERFLDEYWSRKY